jgi:hypothetical protein
VQGPEHKSYTLTLFTTRGPNCLDAVVILLLAVWQSCSDMSQLMIDVMFLNTSPMKAYAFVCVHFMYGEAVGGDSHCMSYKISQSEWCKTVVFSLLDNPRVP